MKVYIGKYPTYRWYHKLFRLTPKQIVSVKIDKHDTWGMNYTLALIILPMLKQLKETTHGYPALPDLLEDAEGVTDDPEKAWDIILDKMIASFSYVIDLEKDDIAFDADHLANHLAAKKGFSLFGKYYNNLWD